jgi:hypothetical protein
MDSSGAIAGISVVGTIVFIAIGIAIGYTIKTGTALPGFQFLVSWFKVLYYFLPYALFLFGVLYDGLVRKIKFFPAGFIGLGAVLISWGVSRIAAGTAVIDTDICGLPGMSNLGSNLAPQNILFASTVMSYIAAYISASQTDSAYSGAAWGGVFITFAIQAVGYVVNKCYDSKISQGAAGVAVNSWILQLGGAGPPAVGLMLGMLIGGGSGALIATYAGNGVGIGLSSEQKQALTSSGPAMGSTAGATGAGKCSSTDSDDQFVCEAYKNGELVTSTIVE